ncbi:MAG: CDP-glycerol glycerophosphotransferase family protein [Clostridia bacterium]|nr:CDP-glycerol glycerophosphotransferase family protein [Clostridia bacterium]
MISVIVPVYNVEIYLEKALESIKAQTYTDFEVIMVNDCSTDSSGKICEEWSLSDSRFKTVHKEQNQGLSAARNTGMKYAGGEYIFFMDSDDSITPETLKLLYNAMIENDVDMVSGNVCYIDENDDAIDELNCLSPVKDELLLPVDYLKKLTEQTANFYCTAWNKLYKAFIFSDIQYPVGKIHEDEAVIHKVVTKCKKIATIKERTYNYLKRRDSITGAQFSVKNLDREDAFIGRINFLNEKGLYDQANRTALMMLDCSIVTFTRCIKYGFYYGNTKDRILSAIKFFYKYASQCKNFTAFEKKVMLISSVIVHCPWIYEKYIDFKVKNENLGTAEAIKDELFELVFKCFSLLPTKDRIIFESHPELTCNTYPVYKYLLEKGINEKYEFVWLSNDASAYTDIKDKNVSFINNLKHTKSVFEKFKYMYYVATAKALVYSNQFLGVYGKDRISLWLQHGMPLKASNGTYCIKNRCTAALCVSEFFADNYSSDARVDKDKMIFCGFPRNDYLNKTNDSLEKFGFEKFDKVIFWLPTYRQRKDNVKNKVAQEFEMENRGTGIPAIETAEDMQKVNTYLKALNCLVVLKPHPAQDLSAITEKGLSNFFIINDASLKEKDVQLYELLGRCDAMITDYSSVYYDYLLTDKPIGLTIGDIDEYIAKRGFVYKNPLVILKGVYINSTDDLISFIGEINNGTDSAKEERAKVKNMIHTVTDGTSAQKVGDYIIEQLNKQ